MRCTATGTYISTDEIDNTKVAQNEKGENGTGKEKEMGGMP
jgi:hypothetical protein